MLLPPNYKEKGAGCARDFTAKAKIGSLFGWFFQLILFELLGSFRNGLNITRLNVKHQASNRTKYARTILVLRLRRTVLNSTLCK